MRGYAMHKNRPWPVGNAHSTTLTLRSHYTHTVLTLHPHCTQPSYSAKSIKCSLPLPCLSRSLPPLCSCLSFFVLNCFVYDFVPQLAFLICCPPTTPLSLSPPTVSCCQVQLIPIGDESSLGFAGFPGPPSSSSSSWSSSAFGLVLRFCLFAL